MDTSGENRLRPRWLSILIVLGALAIVRCDQDQIRKVPGTEELESCGVKFVRVDPNAKPSARHVRSKEIEGEETTPKKEARSADWKELIQEWVRNRFGVNGTVVLAVVLALLGLWWKWDDFAKLPGIAKILSISGRKSLPRANPQRFSVAVANLEGDEDQKQKEILLSTLFQFAGGEHGSGALKVQILNFDRTIEISKGGDEPFDGVFVRPAI